MELNLGFGEVIAAITSIIISISYTHFQSKRQRTAEIITTNRVEWMQKFKEIIVDYTGNIKNIIKIREINKELDEIVMRIRLHLNLSGDQDNEIIEIIKVTNDNVKEYLELRNDRDIIEKDQYRGLVTSVDGTLKEYALKYLDSTKYINNDGYNTYTGNIYETYDIIINELDERCNILEKRFIISENLISILSKIYLKTEWERVKVEAESGKFAKFNFNEKYKFIRHEFEKDIATYKEELCIECELCNKKGVDTLKLDWEEYKFNIIMNRVLRIILGFTVLVFSIVYIIGKINLVDISKYIVVVIAIEYTIFQVAQIYKDYINIKKN